MNTVPTKITGRENDVIEIPNNDIDTKSEETVRRVMMIMDVIDVMFLPTKNSIPIKKYNDCFGHTIELFTDGYCTKLEINPSLGAKISLLKFIEKLHDNNDYADKIIKLQEEGIKAIVVIDERRENILGVFKVIQEKEVFFKKLA